MEPERDGEGWRIRIDPDWPGFAGHFPGDPILPAAVLIDLALRCAADEGRSATGIARARFTAIVRPGDVLRWEAGDTALGRRYTARRGGKVVTEVTVVEE